MSFIDLEMAYFKVPPACKVVEMFGNEGGTYSLHLGYG